MRNIKFCVMTFANIFQWANFIHRISFNEFLVKKICISLSQCIDCRIQPCQARLVVVVHRLYRL